MLLLLSALFIQSCSDKDDADSGSYLFLSKGEEKSISSLSFQSMGGSQMFKVNCDGLWTASESDNTWIKISNHEGHGYSNDSLSYVRLTIERNEGEARKGTITFRSGGNVAVLEINQASGGVDPDDPFESAQALVGNLGLGYNLGNTLDSNPYGSWFDDRIAACKTMEEVALAYETSWGQPETTKKIIDDIAARGFKIIRVPVTWYPHIPGFKRDGSGDYTIDEAWMNRVQTLVDWVLDNDCYCIINVMHDTGAVDGSTDPNKAWLNTDPDAYPVTTAIYQKIWEQVANRFKGYGEKLIFESFNEILDKESTWSAPSTGDANYETINKLQQDFVNTVRATGGNNAYRNLFITTYSATSQSGAINALTVPTDVRPNHIVATLHSYDPYNFCNDNSGADFDWNIYSFDINCEKEIEDIFRRVNARFETLGIPYIFGEFGAIDEKKDVNERIKYAKFVGDKMKTYGTTGLWWMGLYNRKTGEWYDDEVVSALFSVHK